jgi:hypothetical protein
MQQAQPVTTFNFGIALERQLSILEIEQQAGVTEARGGTPAKSFIK